MVPVATVQLGLVTVMIGRRGVGGWVEIIVEAAGEVHPELFCATILYGPAGSPEKMVVEVKVPPFRLYNNPETVVTCIVPVATVQLVFVTVMMGTSGDPGGEIIVPVVAEEIQPELFCAVILYTPGISPEKSVVDVNADPLRL